MRANSRLPRDSAFRDHFKTNFNWQSAVANDDKAVAAALQAPVFQFVELPSRGYGVIHGHWVHYTSTPTSLPTLSPSTPAPTNPTRAPTTAPTTPAPTLGACESYSVFYNGYASRLDHHVRTRRVRYHQRLVNFGYL